MNVFNFNDQFSCFWYPIYDATVKKSWDTIWMADCQAENPGCYWVGSGSNFYEPVPYVDYRHDNGFCASVLRRPLRVANTHNQGPVVDQPR